MANASTRSPKKQLVPCQHKAKAWFPAEAAMTPFSFCSSFKSNSAFKAPRSLKDPERCVVKNTRFYYRKFGLLWKGKNL